MSIDVSTPDGSAFSFPDGTPQDVITGAINQHFGKTDTAPVNAENLVRAAGTGIPVIGGLLNKADAATNAALAPVVDRFLPDDYQKLPEATFGQRYQHALDIQNQKDQSFEQEHPVADTAAQLAGGIGAAAAIGPTALGAKVLGLNGTTLPGMIARGMVSGAGINAADALTRGDDPLSAGLTGGVVGAVVPAAARLASAAAQPVISTLRGITNPTDEAARRVASAIERDRTATATSPPQNVAGNVGNQALTSAEFDTAQQGGQPVNLMDLGGETTRALARSAANTSPEGRAVLNRAIDDRFETQSTRLSDWLRSTFHYPDAQAQQQALDQASRTANGGAYKAAQTAADARFPGGIWSPELERLTSSPDVADAMKNAAQRGAGRAVAEGYGGFNPGVTFDNGTVNFRKAPNGMPAYPDLRFWDYTYRNLRDAGDAAFRSGRNSEGSALSAQANQLRNEIDQRVPEFADARAGASRFFGAQDALEAGQNFVNSKLANGQARSALAQMSPTEKGLFQDGYVDRLTQQIRESPDRRAAINNIAGSPAARERLNIAIGPDRARDLESMLRVEGVMDLARHSVQGNSTTARQLAELGLAGGAYFGTGGNLSNADPSAVMNAALVYGALRGGRHLTGTIDQRVAHQVANLLTSNDPSRLANGMRLLSHNSNLLGGLRNTDTALASIAARGAQPALTH